MDLHYSLKTIKTEGKIVNNLLHRTNLNRFLNVKKILKYTFSSAAALLRMELSGVEVVFVQ